MVDITKVLLTSDYTEFYSDKDYSKLKNDIQMIQRHTYEALRANIKRFSKLAKFSPSSVSVKAK